MQEPRHKFGSKIQVILVAFVRCLSDGVPRSADQVIAELKEMMGVTPDEVAGMPPYFTSFRAYVMFSAVVLRRDEKLIEQNADREFQITQRGMDFLAGDYNEIGDMPLPEPDVEDPH